MVFAQGIDPMTFVRRWTPPPSSSVITIMGYLSNVRACTFEMVEAMLVGALEPNSSRPPYPAVAAGTIAPRLAAFTGTTIVWLASWARGQPATSWAAHARLPAPDEDVVVVDDVVSSVVVVEVA